MLSGIGGVQANVGNSHDMHHGVSATTSEGMPHNQKDSHSDLCGMAVCGPFVQEADGSWQTVPTLFSVQYWGVDRIVTSVTLDVSGKPPRA